jgi:hypothetical protein
MLSGRAESQSFLAGASECPILDALEAKGGLA